MELTLEQIKAWESHTVTKEIMSVVDEETKEAKENAAYNPRDSGATMERVAMGSAYTEGLIVGANGLRNICASLIFRLEKEAEK